MKKTVFGTGSILFTFFFLIISLFSGCASSTKEQNPDFINIPELHNYDVIFIGEDHFNSENFDVQLRLMKHYYVEGIRDFAFEAGYADALFIQHYITTGNKECLEFLFRANRRTPGCSEEALEFYKNIYKWNSKLKDKIKIHGFDVEHKPVIGIAAIYFFILKNYREYKDIPLETSSERRQFIQNYKSGKLRLSNLLTEDSKLFERIMLGIEQAENIYSVGEINSSLREKYIIENFRAIRKISKNQKVFAIMGAWHAALPGFIMGTAQPCLANALKNEIRIASVFLGTTRFIRVWPYSIPIDDTLKVSPYESPYTGNWPYK